MSGVRRAPPQTSVEVFGTVLVVPRTAAVTATPIVREVVGSPFGTGPPPLGQAPDPVTDGARAFPGPVVTTMGAGARAVNACLSHGGVQVYPRGSACAYRPVLGC